MSSPPFVPLPDPLPLAAPAGLLWVLELLTFLLHLVAMNVVLGGSILLLVARWRRRVDYQRQASGLLIQAMPVAMAATITFGVAPLLFVQVLYGRFLYTTSILLGAYWLAVIPLAAAGYYAAYITLFRSNRLSDRAKTALAVTGCCAFAAVAFIFTNNMSLMLRPEAFAPLYAARPAGGSLNLADPSLIPRYLHVVLGAVAVAGVYLAGAGAIQRQKKAREGGKLFRYGLRVFALATAVNLVTGTVFLLLLPRETLLWMMREDWPAIGVLAAALIIALVILPLALLAQQSHSARALLGAIALGLLATLNLMVVFRDSVRRASLVGLTGLPAAEPHWGAILIFGILLAGALVTVTWMVRAVVRGDGLRLNPRSGGGATE